MTTMSGKNLMYFTYAYWSINYGQSNGELCSYVGLYGYRTEAGWVDNYVSKSLTKTGAEQSHMNETRLKNGAVKTWEGMGDQSSRYNS